LALVPGSEPAPPQREHSDSPRTDTEVVTPLTASVNDRCSSVVVLAPWRGACLPATAGPAPEDITESTEPAQQIAQVLDPDSLPAESAEPAGATRTAAGAEPAEAAGLHEPADFVVLLLLLGVAEHRIGLGYLLEAFLGIVVAGVGVGVVLLGELAIGALDLLGGPASFETPSIL
jgi:hypothetical protein